MDFKELLKQFIILLASALFSWIISKDSTFPLTQDQFTALIIYFFALLGIINGVRYQIFLFLTKIMRYKTR